MAKLPSGAVSKTEDDLDTKLSAFTPNISITTKPVVVCGVQRKANIGNFENVDVYCAVVLPVDVADGCDEEELHRVITETAETGFKMASEETYSRYKLLSVTLRE